MIASILRMEAGLYSEKPVRFYKTRLRDMPEGSVTQERLNTII